ncbi:pentapeptide repeat-containing protein [Streptomyces sp. NPDC048383]|uniref:pentapeptide repeat-containing protein n=1 Tax=Streptomyces sp. NPDC048383 TaxID=3155386 RepID=UPI0034453E2A
MRGHAYGFLTAARPAPADLVRVLGEAFGVGARGVDVGPEHEAEGRNWDAPITCGYAYLDRGDLACALSIYAVPAVTEPPTPGALGRSLARELGTTVLLDGGRPDIERVFTPTGGATFARIEEPDGDETGCLVLATQAGVAAFPHAPVQGLPEVVAGLPLAPAGTDPRLWRWADLICRMEADWPPVRWYGLDLYRDVLTSRDELADLAEDPELAALDARFRAVTVDDDGAEIGTENGTEDGAENGAGPSSTGSDGAARPTPAPWYRRRRPVVLPWRVLPPADPEGARWLWEWVRAGFPAAADLTGLDLGGAVLSGADFSQTLFTETRLAGARLVGTDFYRCDLQRADLCGADATGARFVRAVLDGADLRGTVLDGADLVRAELYGADARGASLRGARVLGAALLDTDLRGADLSGARVRENSFEVLLDDSTRVTGLTGTVFGPAGLIAPDGSRHPLVGSALEDWLRSRGGDVRVIAPPGRTRTPKAPGGAGS